MVFCWKIFIICLLIEGGGNSGLGESDENPSNFTDLTWIILELCAGEVILDSLNALSPLAGSKKQHFPPLSGKPNSRLRSLKSWAIEA